MAEDKSDALAKSQVAPKGVEDPINQAEELKTMGQNVAAFALEKFPNEVANPEELRQKYSEIKKKPMGLSQEEIAEKASIEKSNQDQKQLSQQQQERLEALKKKEAEGRTPDEQELFDKMSKYHEQSSVVSKQQLARVIESRPKPVSTFESIKNNSGKSTALGVLSLGAAVLLTNPVGWAILGTIALAATFFAIPFILRRVVNAIAANNFENRALAQITKDLNAQVEPGLREGLKSDDTAVNKARKEHFDGLIKKGVESLEIAKTNSEAAKLTAQSSKDAEKEAGKEFSKAQAEWKKAKDDYGISKGKILPNEAELDREFAFVQSKESEMKNALDNHRLADRKNWVAQLPVKICEAKIALLEAEVALLNARKGYRDNPSPEWLNNISTNVTNVANVKVKLLQAERLLERENGLEPQRVLDTALRDLKLAEATAQSNYDKRPKNASNLDIAYLNAQLDVCKAETALKQLAVDQFKAVAESQVALSNARCNLAVVNGKPDSPENDAQRKKLEAEIVRAEQSIVDNKREPDKVGMLKRETEAAKGKVSELEPMVKDAKALTDKLKPIQAGLAVLDAAVKREPGNTTLNAHVKDLKEVIAANTALLSYYQGSSSKSAPQVESQLKADVGSKDIHWTPELKSFITQTSDLLEKFNQLEKKEKELSMDKQEPFFENKIDFPERTEALEKERAGLEKKLTSAEVVTMAPARNFQQEIDQLDQDRMRLGAKLSQDAASDNVDLKVEIATIDVAIAQIGVDKCVTKQLDSSVAITVLEEAKTRLASLISPAVSEKSSGVAPVPPTEQQDNAAFQHKRI